jgi:hypothetical protein
MSSPSRPQPHAGLYHTPLLNGEQGIAQTIALMRNLVDDALADPQFVRRGDSRSCAPAKLLNVLWRDVTDCTIPTDVVVTLDIAPH